MEISGVGSTPTGAVQTAELVGTALTGELDGLQASHGVDRPVQDSDATCGGSRQRGAASVRQAPDARRRVRDGRDPAVRGHLGGRGADHPAGGAEEARPTRERRKGGSSEGAATNDSQNTRAGERRRAQGPGRRERRGMTRGGGGGGGERALCGGFDGAPAEPAARKLRVPESQSGRGIKLDRGDADTSRMQNEGKIGGDGAGESASRWQMAGNGRTADAAGAAGAQNGQGRRNGRAERQSGARGAGTKSEPWPTKTQRSAPCCR